MHGTGKKQSTTRIEVPNLKDTVYEAIKMSSLRHEYPPGAKIPEAAIAESLGVSRTPVREALNCLERESIIDVVPRHGAYIRTFTEEEILEILLIQEVLESLVARLAATRIPDEAIAAMERDLKDMAANAQRTKKLDGFMSYDIDFHGKIASICGSPKLGSLFANIKAQMTMCRFATMYLPGRFRKSVKEHLAIIHALKSRNPEKAEKAARAHISKVIADFEHKNSKRAKQQSIHLHVYEKTSQQKERG